MKVKLTAVGNHLTGWIDLPDDRIGHTLCLPYLREDWGCWGGDGVLLPAERPRVPIAIFEFVEDANGTPIYELTSLEKR